MISPSLKRHQPSTTAEGAAEAAETTTTTTTSSTTADGSSLVDGEAAEVAEVEDALSASQAADFLSLTMLMMVNRRRQWQQKREVIGVEACLSTESLYSANDIKRYVADWHQFPVM